MRRGRGGWGRGLWPSWAGLLESFQGQVRPGPTKFSATFPSSGVWGPPAPGVSGEPRDLVGARQCGLGTEPRLGDRAGPAPRPPPGGAHPTPRPVALLLYSFSHLLQRWGGAVLGQGSGLRGSTRETSDSKCPSASDTATASGSERQGDVRLALEGGAAVGETFAAVQVRGDVPDAHGLQAGGG